MATDIIARPADADREREIHEQLGRRYDAGFVTDIEIRHRCRRAWTRTSCARSRRKKDEPEWMTDWRLAAYRHWLTMPMPRLGQARRSRRSTSRRSATTPRRRPKYASLDEVPQELLDTYDKLGVPLHERARLAGVAVDAVFDSVSVGTTFRKELAEKGVIFCSMSEAVREHPELVQAVPGQRGADRRQLLRRAQLGGVLRRQLRVHPARACAARWS